MFVDVGTVDNFTTIPTPVLDDTQPEGYRLEQRLQVTLKSAADERQITVEFRLGADSEAPAEQTLNTWLESGEIVQAFCTGLAARPFVHQEDKQYRTKGKEVQIGDKKAALDAFVVFAGFAMVPLGDTSLTLEEAVRKARAAYKRGQRAYRAQRSAERLQQLQAELPKRIEEMKQRKAAQEAEKAAETTAAQNGRRK
jgi:hypothetical protein